jgi:hypothetical protein
MAGGGTTKKRQAAAAHRPAASCMATAIVAVVALLLAASSALLFFMPPPPQTTTAGPREPVEMAIGVAGREGWLDALRAWAHLRPRPAAAGEPPLVKAAAKKSLQMGKEATEHTAASGRRRGAPAHRGDGQEEGLVAAPP